ncbi:MAG: glycosyltransferase [Chitinophagaceae bacterium]|nr:glycosyltransferase [Chitinophagaceae bacterium]
MSKTLETPLVSVIIPCYNAAKYIGETILSVKNQTYKNVEIIIVDDGSTDHSSAIINQYIDQCNIKYIYQENAGVSIARNNGIASSVGEYIVPLDADDILLTECIEKKLSHAILYDCNLVFSWVEITDEKLNPLDIWKGRGPQKMLDELFVFAPPAIISPSSTLINRKVFDEVGFFDKNLSVSADLDLWIRIAMTNKIGKINEALSKYRLVPGSMNTNTKKQVKDMNIIFCKYKSNPDFKRRLLILRKGFYYSIAGNGWQKKNILQLIRYSILYFIISTKLFFNVWFSRFR